MQRQLMGIICWMCHVVHVLLGFLLSVGTLILGAGSALFIGCGIAMMFQPGEMHNGCVMAGLGACGATMCWAIIRVWLRYGNP